jgi:hypothetical protein
MPIITSRGSGMTQTGWVNPQNGYDNGNNTFTTFTTTTANITNTVFITGYDFSSIPAGSTLNSVLVIVKQYVNVASRWLSPQTRAFIGDISIGSTLTNLNPSNSQNNSDTYSVNYLLNQIQDPDFRMQFIARKANNTQSSIQYLDFIEISVDYTELTTNVQSWGTIPIS